MKIINYLNIVLIGVILTSCSKVTDPVKEIGLGSRDINYQADEKVDSLIIPPNLTEPSNLQALTEVEEILDDNQVIQRVQNIEIKRDKYRRWLLVDLPPSEVWALSKEFFRSYGFKIEKENQKIGLIEAYSPNSHTSSPHSAEKIILIKMMMVITK